MAYVHAAAGTYGGRDIALGLGYGLDQRLALCKQCGKPIAPDSAEGLCSVCRIKARTLKRQEEARQRAEQLKAERAAKAAEEAAKAAENTAGTAAEATSEAAAPAAETALPETIPAGQSAAPANVTAPALGEPVSE